MQNRTYEKKSEKPPQIILDLIDQVKQTRLYFFKTIKPTCLLYCDDNGNNFKVELSTKMICLCNQNKIHCIHTIHALLKVFQVNEQCPILWLKIIFYIRYLQYCKWILQINNRIKQHRIIDKRNQVIKQQGNKYNIQFYNKQQLEKDDLCPICQELLLYNEALVHYSKQCENIFHSKCFKIWVEQQKSDFKNINCRMCRIDWSGSTLNEIVQIEKEFLKQSQTLNKLFRIRQSFHARPKQFSQHHQYNSHDKQMQNQQPKQKQYPIKGSLSAYRNQQGQIMLNPSIRFKIENIM